VLTRPAPPPDFSVRYGAHRDHVADVRLPGPGPAVPPLVIFLHGGFWRYEYDRTHTGPLATALAAAGAVVVTAEYRRTGAPDAPPGGSGWLDTFDDVADVVRLVPELVAARIAVDLDRVVLAGHSAGGQLALWAGAGMSRPGRSAGVVALAPVADLAAAYELDLDEGAVVALLGGGPAEVPERYQAVDPVGVAVPSVPVRVIHGTADQQVPIELTRRYVAAARARGDQVEFSELPGVDHFAVIDPESAVWGTVVAAFRGLWTSPPAGSASV
jgi:acetyl esterase/lipase